MPSSPKHARWVSTSKRSSSYSNADIRQWYPPPLRFSAMDKNSLSQSPPVIEIRRLTRLFESSRALDDISLTIARGGVFGLIGGNGAGKTTLIKHLLGMLRAQSGTVRVFGLDPVQNPVGTLGRIGYLSEDRDLPDWMSVRELMRYTQSFFPTWDDGFAEELREMFDLNPAA